MQYTDACCVLAWQVQPRSHICTPHRNSVITSLSLCEFGAAVSMASFLFVCVFRSVAYGAKCATKSHDILWSLRTMHVGPAGRVCSQHLVFTWDREEMDRRFNDDP